MFMEKCPVWWEQERGIRQHRKRLSNELKLNLKRRPLDSAVALLKNSEVSR